MTDMKQPPDCKKEIMQSDYICPDCNCGRRCQTVHMTDQKAREIFETWFRSFVPSHITHAITTTALHDIYAARGGIWDAFSAGRKSLHSAIAAKDAEIERYKQAEESSIKVMGEQARKIEQLQDELDNVKLLYLESLERINGKTTMNTITECVINHPGEQK